VCCDAAPAEDIGRIRAVTVIKPTESFYFGYGSNLNQDHWQEWCAAEGFDPSTVWPIGPAWLPDKELAFRYKSGRWEGGVLDLRDHVGQATAGWLYAVTEAGWSALDCKEGVRSNCYQRIPWYALTSTGQVLDVQTYEVVPKKRRLFVSPSPAYKEIVRTGRADLDIAEDGHLVAAAENAPCSWLSSHVFVYGTCRPRQPRFDVVKDHGVDDISSGTVSGELLDLGAYPGLVSGTHTVRGEVVTSADPEGLLRALDVVEGFSGWGAPDNLYTRALMFVQTTRGPLLSWVYRYAGPSKGVLRIESGDWLKRK